MSADYDLSDISGICQAVVFWVKFYVVRRVKIIILVILGLSSIIGLTFLVVNLLRPKVAGIYIESLPSATVFIDGQEVGRTPYEQTREQGELIIKLVPDSFETPLSIYEAKVNLVAGVQTVIKRDFGETEDMSSGEIISFEKVDPSQSSLAVVSIPDSSELLIDGKERAFTPHRTSSLLPGEHTLALSADGYKERVLSVRTHQGYKLTAVVKLSKAASLQGKEEEVQTEKEDEGSEEIAGTSKVRILETPTGFLRVRKEPSTLGIEVGQVKPGESYDLLTTDEKTGWFKIKFEEDEGWITNQYAEVVNEKLTPTPTKKPIPAISQVPVEE